MYIEMQFNWDINTIISIVAVVLAIVAIIIARLSSARIINYLNDHQSQHGINSPDGDIRSEIVDVVLNSTRLKLLLLDKKTPVQTIVQEPELTTEHFNAIVDTVLTAIEGRLANKEEDVDVASDSDITEGETIVQAVKVPENTPFEYRYATSYDIKNRTFYRVEEHPSEDTIYELIIDSENADKGSFSIYKRAYKKVTECQDFLEGACDVSGSGSIIQIVEQGLIAMEGGKWIVEKPLEMKFV